MKLTFFRGKAPNFGDELNAYMWPRLLPRNFLDEDEGELFVGIGSILLDTMPAAPLKHVMGSGYAGYTAPPPIHDGSWNVVFVRGPRTAAALGLPREAAICDSAILLRALELPAPAANVGVAFMPHYESLDRGFWVEACALAGITLIDPRHEVEPVIAAIRGARLLITEAMHGAIVADALRIPWIPALPIHPRHHGKWLDWSDSLSIELRPHRIRPTSLMELYVAMSGGRGNIEGRAGRVSRGRLAAPANKALTLLAAERLRKLARREPQLSSDRKIEEATMRAMDALDRFVRSRNPAYGALSA